MSGKNVKNYFSEFIGTLGFVLIGWGAVVFARPFIGYLGVSMAFGMAYAAFCFAFPEGHFNPAATVAAVLSGHFRSGGKIKTFLSALGYILFQTAGACSAVALICFIQSGKIGYVHQEMVNIYLIDRYTLSSAFCLEAVLSFLFLSVFLNTYKNNGYKASSCGFLLTALYLLSYPVTKGGLNPARSTATALFAGEEALAQLPVFWGSALIAALIAGIIYNPQIGKLFRKKSS